MHENDNDGCLAGLCNNNKGRLVDCIKCTNNKSLLSTTNGAKHNEVSNGNNIDYNPSYNNDGRLVKYDYIDADGINHISEANVDNSTNASGHNEQKTIKIRANDHNNEWWLCFDDNDIDLIIKHNNMNNNNNNNIDHNPSQNNDGGSIGDIDVSDVPELYNFLCYAPTSDTNSNYCWCFNNDDHISKYNNMINNNNVGPSPLYDNEGSLIEDGNIPKCTFLCHTYISDAISNIKLIIVSSKLKGGVRKVMKDNSNSDSISPIYDHRDCLLSEVNVNNSKKSDNTFKDETIDMNNDGTSDDIFKSIINNNINNNNSNNNFNRNSNNNDNNILTINESNESQHNNIEIDYNTLVTTDLKLNDATSNYANNNDGNSSSEINCLYDIPDSSQYVIAQVNMKVMYSVVDSTTYNGEGVRKCSHYDNNTTIFTTPKYSKVGVGVEEVNESIATGNSISLFKTTPSRENEGV